MVILDIFNRESILAFFRTDPPLPTGGDDDWRVFELDYMLDLSDSVRYLRSYFFQIKRGVRKVHANSQA